ncbi:hypothetical protein DPMN_189943 [Dreissena polymorpha]|uniref:Uncharacterized protein n=1 Tax=Dreissena polymorpha TaxID=45954 RepID=A0A9D4DUG2_DREPO|nr:hypothetical protein DPMN_189943 [Dreissena polymorpha]
MTSSSAVSEPGIPIAVLVYTRTPLDGVTTPQYFIESLLKCIWSKALVKPVTIRYLYGAKVRKMVSTSGIKDGCGLLYLATSLKAVTSLLSPCAFFTKNEGFKYSTLTSTSSGRAKKPLSSRSSNLACNSTSLSLAFEVLFLYVAAVEWDPCKLLLQ